MYQNFRLANRRYLQLVRLCLCIHVVGFVEVVRIHVFRVISNSNVLARQSLDF